MIPLDADALNAACRESGLPWRVLVADELPSTSDALREAAARGEAAGLVVFAEAQTAGRGRRDNRWVTPKGMDLMFSLLLRPPAPLMLWPRLTTLAALAVCRAVEDELPLAPQIKWPNDIYLRERKAGGLLAETVTTPQGMALVLGIGLNVNVREFPLELAAGATSLQAELRSVVVPELDRVRLAWLLLRELAVQFGRLEMDYSAAVAEVRARSWLLGKQIRATVEGRELYGRAMDLDAEGHLMLALPDGTITTLTSAEGVRQVV